MDLGQEDSDVPTAPTPTPPESSAQIRLKVLLPDFGLKGWGVLGSMSNWPAYGPLVGAYLLQRDLTCGYGPLFCTWFTIVFMGL